jgi:hypothetical protein
MKYSRQKLLKSNKLISLNKQQRYGFKIQGNNRTKYVFFDFCIFLKIELRKKALQNSAKIRFPSSGAILSYCFLTKRGPF